MISLLEIGADVVKTVLKREPVLGLGAVHRRGAPLKLDPAPLRHASRARSSTWRRRTCCTILSASAVGNLLGWVVLGGLFEIVGNVCSMNRLQVDIPSGVLLLGARDGGSSSTSRTWRTLTVAWPDASSSASACVSAGEPRWSWKIFVLERTACSCNRAVRCGWEICLGGNRRPVAVRADGRDRKGV